MQLKRRVVIPVVTVVAVLGVAGSSWAIADHRSARETETRGTCAEASYELSAEREGSGLEVSFELESRAPGEAWSITLTHNGVTLLGGRRVTDEDAEIDVDSYVGSAGKHEFAITFGTAGAQACTADLSY